jgi:hypothetical protein
MSELDVGDTVERSKAKDEIRTNLCEKASDMYRPVPEIEAVIFRL